MSIFWLIDLTVAVLVVSLLVLALQNGGYRHRINRLFAGAVFFVLVWFPSVHLGNSLWLSPELATRFNYLVFGCGFGSTLMIVKIMVYLVRSKKLDQRVKFVEPVLWAICLISFTPLVGEGVEKQGDIYGVIFGPLILLYACGIIFLLFAIAYVYRQGAKRLTGSELHRFKVLGWATIFGSIAAALFSLLIPLVTGDYELTQVGLTPIIAIVFAMYYGAIRHGLFDIKLAAVRSLAYIFAITVLGVVYYFMAYAISILLFQGDSEKTVSFSPINIVLALALALIFQPIKRFFDRTTNRFFYRDTYSSEKFFANLGELLASTTDLRGILQRASEEIASTFKAEQCFFFLYYTNAVDHHLSSGTGGHARLPLYDARMLDSYTTKGNTDSIIITDHLAEDSDVRRMLISHKIALVMPLRHSGKVIGYVCLGEQQSRGYTKRDIGVLTTIASELVIAIQNALSVHEVREINATLNQRINVATKELRATNAQLRHIDMTKDEFVSMASHQLRTPLTSVKGYISMVMEGDVGKITDQQHHLLSEAFESSERMVRLINDFLNVSRLQTGRFVIEKRETDIGKVVGQEVESLRSIAGTHGLKLAYKASHNAQLIWCDEDKIRQVIMNFIDNAIYYSRPDSTIHVTLDIINEEVVLTVRDTGIGVPIDAQPRLFSKFFRATNARKQRPDGTGVGLFLAKKVITEHKGQVIFSSVENQGSVFGFRIPLVTEKEPDDSDD